MTYKFFLTLMMNFTWAKSQWGVKNLKMHSLREGAKNRRPKFFAALLLPFKEGGKEIDWRGLFRQAATIIAAGGIPVVNADTGYAFLLTPEVKAEIARELRKNFEHAEFVIGLVPTAPVSGAKFDPEWIRPQIVGIPADDKIRFMIMLTPELALLQNDDLVEAYRRMLKILPRPAFGHELPSVFVPYGRTFNIYEWASIFMLDGIDGIKISELSGSAFMERQALANYLTKTFKIKASDGGPKMVLNGDDWKLRPAWEYGGDLLVGAGCVIPAVYAKAFDLWMEDSPLFETAIAIIQDVANTQFRIRRKTVTAYTHSTAYILWKLGIIESPDPPVNCPEIKRRTNVELKALDAVIERLRKDCKTLKMTPVNKKGIEEVIANGGISTYVEAA